MMKNSPFIPAGTTAICCSGAGLERLKQENENSSQGEEHSQEQARQAWLPWEVATLGPAQ